MFLRPFRAWSLGLAVFALVLPGGATATTASAATATDAATTVAAEALESDIPPGDYQQVQLAYGPAETGEAMSLAVLPDRAVLHTARDGTVRHTDAAGNTKVAGRLDVYTHDEEGLQGVAADPGFAANRYVYLYYSPRLGTPAGDAPATGTAADFEPWKGHLNLSRFTLRADNTLDMASEKVVLEVPNDRGQCCHVGGDIDFDAAGNLYLTTGDDTNPFESSGYSPIDERADRNPQFDAQRSSANTADLRGKVLRIKPTSTGGYTVPPGNLFPAGTARTRPEIYAMGFRNPFRMSVDKATGTVYLGDYGPDAGGADGARGPGGQVEFNRITRPGNYGWPYCTGSNTAAETYNEYTFPSGPSGARYDCAGGPANNSFRNTGLTALPAAAPAWIKYGDAGSPPEFGGGSESPMGGEVYRFDPDLASGVKFPASLDGRFFAAEYGRRWIKSIEVKPDGSHGVIEDFPWTGTQVMDTDFGPDGALYVLDYGSGGGNQGLYRVEYVGGSNRSPVARAAADRTSGPTPLTVAFSSAGSSDPEGGPLTHRWDFGDGATSTAAHPGHTYTTAGTYRPTLTVTDSAGLTATASLVVTVGNTAPSVTLTAPGDGALFDFGDTVPFTVTVTDPEDGPVDCSKVKVAYLLGHDSHRHEITSKNGCSGTLTIPTDGEHDSAANLYGVLDAEYTDRAGLTSHSLRILQPRHRQAEHFGGQSGIQTAGHGGAEGGRTVGFTDDGDWISFEPYRLGDAERFTARVSSGGAGGILEVRAGSPTGTLLGSVAVAPTGGWDTFAEVRGGLAGAPAGTTELFLVFKGVTGQGNLFDLDAFTLSGSGDPDVSVEGEAFSSGAGVQVAGHAGASGGATLGYIDHGDWVGYSSVSTVGARSFTARVSSAGAGGTIEVRAGSQSGTLLGSVVVAPTGGWESFTTVSTALTGAGSGPLFLRFTGGAGALFDIDTFTLETSPATGEGLSPNVHLFYYPWYGSPSVLGGWRHWQQGGRTPPDDIGADLYPKLGPYDSADIAGAVDQHMRWVARSGAGVIVYSWWGRGGYEDGLARKVMDAAQRQGIKVAWHLEPYSGRTARSTVDDIRYINDTYGSHPAFHRDAAHGNRSVFYVFESLRIGDWSALDEVSGTSIVLAQTTDTTKVAHFSGLYTYDGIAGATAPGWKQAGEYARANGLVWAPSVAPGYIDDRAVPGNTTPTLGRDNGAAYDRQWSNALDPAIGGDPAWVSVTSFNEWHEGSSIEPAADRPPAGHGYQTFSGAYGKTGEAAETAYLDRTKHWVDRFEAARTAAGKAGGR
ncbi:carbohydrate-binding protein [Streptomyces sp. V1I6]|uniref:carbohydrate-binding protein n=1 Tax=Streptomyces sp. V1I6 TaxID=3042273 RepID=UPI002786EA0D|nr:carbohydrate-binding protein [Streptomyces sp. V1I6]MDQ0840869.1 glucose/arabinose dehydrogenase/PKD repeat protein [Streptomyces sp. V1I6]